MRYTLTKMTTTILALAAALTIGIATDAVAGDAVKNRPITTGAKKPPSPPSKKGTQPIDPNPSLGSSGSGGSGGGNCRGTDSLARPGCRGF